jgi:hypothetical protein
MVRTQSGPGLDDRGRLLSWIRQSAEALSRGSNGIRVSGQAELVAASRKSLTHLERRESRPRA